MGKYEEIKSIKWTAKAATKFRHSNGGGKQETARHDNRENC